VFIISHAVPSSSTLQWETISDLASTASRRSRKTGFRLGHTSPAAASHIFRRWVGRGIALEWVLHSVGKG
jgi:hypothetical protein